MTHPTPKAPEADAAGAAPSQAPQDITAMVDAAMVEMSNIHPPLRRSECERLIRAAIGMEGRKPWEIPGPNQTNPPLPRDLDPTVPHGEGDSTDGVEEAGRG